MDFSHGELFENYNPTLLLLPFDGKPSFGMPPTVKSNMGMRSPPEKTLHQKENKIKRITNVTVKNLKKNDQN